MNKEKIIGPRIASIFIDQFFMFIICGSFGAGVSILTMRERMKPTHTYENHFFIHSIIYPLLAGIFIYLFKDSFNGRSIGKRIAGLQIVDNKTGIAASPAKCLIRNVFTLIWPIEFIVTIINPFRRIGDYVANTRVFFYDRNEKGKVQYFSLLSSFVIALVVFFFIARLINKFILNLNAKETPAYVATSYNFEESAKIMHILSDSLDQNITSDIRVYDSIKNTNIKYISAIIQIKGNANEFMNDDREVMKLMLSQFPKGSFVGEIRYYYDGRGAQSVSIRNIKW